MSALRIPAALFAILLATAVVSAKDLIELIPKDVLAYVVVDDLNAVDKKIQDLAGLLHQQAPPLLPLVQQQTGLQEGIDEKGDFGVVVMSAVQGPAVAVFVPVTDYKKFIGQLEPDDPEKRVTSATLAANAITVGQLDNYAVISSMDNQVLVEQIVASEAVRLAPSDATRTLVADHDISIVVTQAGITMLCMAGTQGLEMAKGMIIQQQGEDNPALMGLNVYVELLRQIDTNVSSYTCGIQLDAQEALVVNESIGLVADGNLVDVLADGQSPNYDLLDNLPNAPYVIAGGGVIPEKAWTAMMDFSSEFIKKMPNLYGMNEEQTDKMMELSQKYFGDMQSMSMLWGTGQPDAPLYSDVLVAVKVKDASKYIANYRTFMEEVQKLAPEKGSFFADSTVETIKLADKEALKVTMPIPGMQAAGLDQEELDRIMKLMYGGDEVTVYLAAVSSDTVLMSYVDSDIVTQAIKAGTISDSSLAGSDALKVTRKLLPTGAHAVGYWSPDGTLRYVERAAKLFSGQELPIKLPNLPDAPPIGFALVGHANRLDMKFVVPRQTLESIGEAIDAVKQAQQ